jgi:DNA-directed RNA polymerase subunit alpha
VEGIKEDVVEIMLNLKQLIVKVYGEEPVVLSLTKKGPGVVTAGDFDKNSNVDIFNKDLVIATLTNSKTFELEVTVGSGRGFKAAEEKDRQNFDLGTIMVDSIYTPVRDVGYHIEFARVGDITNYEKLTVNIETNGTITPSEAMRQATQILMDHFSIVLLSSQEQSEKDGISQAVEVEEKSAEKEPAKKTKTVKAKKKTKK